MINIIDYKKVMGKWAIDTKPPPEPIQFDSEFLNDL